MKKSYLFLFSLLWTFFFVSCSEEKTKLPGDGGRTELPDDGQCEMVLTDSVIYEYVLSQLVQIDTLENGEIRRSLLHGKALHKTRPTEYYLVADSIAEAFTYFKSALVPFFLEDSLQQTVAGTWQLNTLGGSLTFHSEPTTDGLATVEVCLNDLPEITRFIFITQNEWPTNDLQSSPFKRGMILSCRNNGYTYFCVRDGNEMEGLFITFNGGWQEDFFSRAQKSKYYNYQAFTLKSKCANQAEWVALKRELDNYPNRTKEMLALAKDSGYTESNDATIKALYDLVVQKSGWFLVGGIDWSSHFGEWCANKYSFYVVTRFYYDCSEQKFCSKTYGENGFVNFKVGHPERDEYKFMGSSVLYLDAHHYNIQPDGGISLDIHGQSFTFDIIAKY